MSLPALGVHTAQSLWYGGPLAPTRMKVRCPQTIIMQLPSAGFIFAFVLFFKRKEMLWFVSQQSEVSRQLYYKHCLCAGPAS